MTVIVGIFILLELCFFIPLADIKKKESRCSSYVRGKVCEIQKKTKRKFLSKQYLYIPTISYEVDGNNYKVQYGKSKNANEYQTDDQFWVMYNPKNPVDIFQDDSFVLLGAKLMSIVGILTIITTLLLAVTF